MFSWLRCICTSRPQTLTPAPAAAPEQRRNWKQHAVSNATADAAKQPDQDQAGFGSPVAGAGGRPNDAPAIVLLTPVASSATAAGTATPATRSMQHTPGSMQQTPSGPSALQQTPPQQHATGPALSFPTPASSDCRTPALRHPAQAAPEGSTGGPAAPRSGPGSCVSSGFLLEDGKPVGIPNTVSKYAPNRPLAPHLTPFERRVERKLEEEEEVIKQQQRGGSN